MSADYVMIYPVISRWSFWLSELNHNRWGYTAVTAPAMCDFVRLNDMVCGALPYVEEWSRTPVQRDQLEPAGS
jgi:hypothetical protein